MEVFGLIVGFLIIFGVYYLFHKIFHATVGRGANAVYRHATKAKRENKRHEAIRKVGDELYSYLVEAKEENAEVSFEDLFDYSMGQAAEEIGKEGFFTRVVQAKNFIELIGLDSFNNYNEKQIKAALDNFKLEVKTYIMEVYGPEALGHDAANVEAAVTLSAEPVKAAGKNKILKWVLIIGGILIVVSILENM